MILGLGVDLVHLSRFTRLLSKGEPFVKRLCGRILHPNELSQLPSLNTSAATRYLAGSWAAKEAVFKTLDERDQQTFQFNQWYKYKVGNRPAIASDTTKDSFMLSISHDNDMLIATVLRQSKTT
ncbi:hypothetical protein FT663_00094 [Candidozyma haemuli var. vulneris]|nr:hypothetical protein FT662_00260 [[Candida] haemuloni var. vulneris]KAF3995871.1 hypothetical protein FT663_00094 [[Candida] haemuloni var. vulneris]